MKRYRCVVSAGEQPGRSMALGYRLRGIPPTAEALARNRESPQQPLPLSVARGSIAAEPRGGRGPESPLRLGAAAPRSRGFP